MNALKWASRARGIKNWPVPNLDAGTVKVQRLQAELKTLKTELGKLRAEEMEEETSAEGARWALEDAQRRANEAEAIRKEAVDRMDALLSELQVRIIPVFFFECF
jgi:chromosome segregation ATPase